MFFEKMSENQSFDQVYLEHPAVVEFYDFWECGTDAELNERFEFVWSSFSNQKWGNESIKEKVRALIVSRFAC